MADLKDLEQRYYAAFNARDFESYDRFFTEDCEVTAPGPMTMRGIEAMKAFDRAWTSAFPDAVITLEQQVLDGSTLISRNRFTGRQTGVFQTPGGDIPPTGRRLEGEYTAWMEMENGRCKAVRFYYDQMEILAQLGLMPAASPR